MSIHEESTIAGQGPMMGVFNNLVMYDQHVPQSGLNSIVPDLATEWSWNEDGTSADLQAAPGRQMARRQAVHRQATSNAPSTCCRATAPRSCGVNPRKAVVPQPRRGRRQGRRRGDLPAEAAAAGLHRAARVGLHADLSLPCAAARDAAASDRHRAVQVRRVQAERDHQGRAQPRLLEEGPALSRRHRVDDHQEPGDRACWPSSPASRHDLAVFLPGAAAERHARSRSRRRSASWCRPTSSAT